MGYRTVLVLSNDHAHVWNKDPELGRKIMHAAGTLGSRGGEFEYGLIVECVHADTQTVAFLDGYSGTTKAYSQWRPAETAEERDLKMLKELADRMGYRIVKKATK